MFVSMLVLLFFFFFSSRRRHTRWNCDWSSDVCSSDLARDCWMQSERIVGSHRTLLLRPKQRFLAGAAQERRNPGAAGIWRSEERRVGKECRSRWSPEQ